MIYILNWFRAAVTTSSGKTEYYTGLTGGAFKTRLYGHKTRFNNEKYMHKQHSVCISGN